MTDLEHRARQLLARASVIPEASAAQLDSSKIKHGKPGDTPPKIAGESTYDELARILKHWPITTDKIHKAETALRAVTNSPPPPVNVNDRGTIHWKRRIANDKRGATQAAAFYGVSRQTVYDYRDKYRDEEAA